MLGYECGRIMISQTYTSIFVTYRPDFTKPETVLLAVLLLGESLGETVLCRKLESWAPVIAADPNADIPLLSAILDKIQTEALNDPSFLNRSAEWGTSIQISSREVSSSEAASTLIENLFDAYPESRSGANPA